MGGDIMFGSSKVGKYFQREVNLIALEDGSRIGVVGGGPAGSFFSHFVLQFAQRIGIKIIVDIYERKNFPTLGPAGCNMCAGVISESLIQALSIVRYRVTFGRCSEGRKLVCASH